MHSLIANKSLNEMDHFFKNKKILVTGAGQGIGRELVKTLVTLGSEVVAVDKSLETLESLRKEVPDVKVLNIDITDIDENAIRNLGPYHCLVNNAGIGIFEPFLQASLDNFDKLSQIVAQQMVQHNIRGSIVNVSSQASKRALRDHSTYCSSKAGLDMLTKVLALELGEFGIRVNCVNPTVVMTAMGQEAWSDPAKSKPMKDRIPLGRFAKVEDVVNTIMFLLSDKSCMVNGTTLAVDGGFWAT